MADPTTNLTDEERQRLLASASQPIIPSLHSIPPLPATQQANLMSGTKVAPQVGKDMFAAGMPSVTAAPGTADYGAQRQEKLDYEKMHPWGSPVSAQPGTWGKIGHVASRIGNIAGDILAPGITANIPGSDLNKQREAAQNAKWINLGSENELRQAQEEGIEAKPEIERLKEEAAENRATAAEEGREKRLGETTAAQQKRAEEAEAAREKMQGTALTAQEQRTQEMIEAANQRQEKALNKPEKEPRQLVSVPQPDGSQKIIEARPGSVLPPGARTIQQFGHEQEPTADEKRRADLANNLNENLDALEDIVKRRPELFGPVHGRLTEARMWAGTGDPDVAKLKTIKEQTGMAMVGAHAMRNAQHVEAAANSIYNAFHNQPDAILSSIQAARDSAHTFLNDAQKGAPQGAAPAGGGDTVNVTSPDGTPGTIPRANLQKALSRGYKQVP